MTRSLGSFVLFIMITLSACAAAPSDPPRHSEARAELARWNAKLVAFTEEYEWPATVWADSHSELEAEDYAEAVARNPLAELAGHLVLFESRFGVDPEELPGWEALVTTLGRMRARLATEEPRRGGGWLLARAMLHELTGSHAEAQRLLFGDAPRSHRIGSWMHASESLYWLSTARAVTLDLAGDTERALLWYHDAWHWLQEDRIASVFGYHRVAGDLFGARWVELLAAAGEWDAAESVIWVLKETHADSHGLAIAKQFVARRPAGERGAARRLMGVAVPLSEAVNFQYGHWVGGDPSQGYAFVVGVPEVRETWEALAFRVAWLPEPEGSPIASHRSYEGEYTVLGASDPRAEAILERFASDAP